VRLNKLVNWCGFERQESRPEPAQPGAALEKAAPSRYRAECARPAGAGRTFPVAREVAMPTSLPVINLSEAKFECIYGRGCEGICCQNGRPGVYPDEEERISANLDKFLPLLRPEARQLIEESGYLSGRRKGGLPMIRVLGGWCIFFHEGCVLHKVGAAEGDKYRYKPAPCALFPLARTENGDWYVRQKGIHDEEWDLFCLDPASSARLAGQSLQEEIRLAAHYMDEEAQAQAAADLDASEPAFAASAVYNSTGE
jgi:hypothetical protein